MSRRLPPLPNKVQPGLFIGDVLMAQNKAGLEFLGVTHIVSALPGFSPKFPDAFKYHVVSVQDEPSEDLLAHFDACNAFIDEARSGGGCVFVHCAAGVSRSATIVIAYLMFKLDLAYALAREMLENARPVIYPNAGFVEQLQRYERHLGANRALQTK